MLLGSGAAKFSTVNACDPVKRSGNAWQLQAHISLLGVIVSYLDKCMGICRKVVASPLLLKPSTLIPLFSPQEDMRETAEGCSCPFLNKRCFETRSIWTAETLFYKMIL